MPLNWNSNRITKVVASTLSAEALAMEHGINEAIYSRQVLEEVFGLPEKSIEINVYTDSKNLLQGIQGNKGISEKRLRRDINIMKQTLEDKKVSAISWIPAEQMLADSMTKKTANPAKLLAVLQTNSSCEAVN